MSLNKDRKEDERFIKQVLKPSFTGTWSCVDCKDRDFIKDFEKELAKLNGEDYVNFSKKKMYEMAVINNSMVRTGKNALINKGVLILRKLGYTCIHSIQGGTKENPTPSTFSTYTEFQEKLAGFSARKLGSGAVVEVNSPFQGTRLSVTFIRNKDNFPSSLITELGIVVVDGNRQELLNRIVEYPTAPGYILPADSDTVFYVEIDEIYNT